jgi:methylmalonyl-CoA mutase
VFQPRDQGDQTVDQSDSDELRLAGEHPPAERDQWRELVRGVLAKSGRDVADLAAPEDLLVAHGYDGVDIAPLYTAADGTEAAGPPGLAPFTRGGRPQGNLPDGWDVRARHDRSDPAAVNEAVLTDLEHGVRSLWLVLGPGALPIADLPAALDGVLLDLAPITLDAGPWHDEALQALLRLHAERGIPTGQVTGNAGVDPLGELARTGEPMDLDIIAGRVGAYARRYPQLRCMVVDALPYHDAGGSDAEELAASIATGVAYLRALTAYGLDVHAAAEQLEFRYAVTADQFAGIAKLRAARRLWARVTEVAGVRPESRGQRQHAVTSAAMMTRRDPWVNMLRTTLACFAAGVGGADAVTVAPFDSALGEPTAFARRIARNTSAILLEESHLAGVIDPGGGSWYLESRTAELARAAWQVFTEIERAGGMAEALTSGALAERLAGTWRRRERDLATRKAPITGVSEFPALDEEPLTRPPAAPIAPGGLPRVRYAEPFEQFRDRSDRWLARSGARPAVFLATLGPLAAHTARSGFAANLLQAGGFHTPAGGPTDSLDAVVQSYRDSECRLVCLCGSDSGYRDFDVPALAAALKEAGAHRVLLAGPPAAEHAGVDEFLYRGCVATDVLANTWSVLEEHS